jgi:hypothetical protein
MDLVKSWIGARQPSDVQDAAPQRVGLRGYPETRSEGQLQELARRGCEDGARRAGEEATGGAVGLARPESDGDVDGDDLGVRQLLEAGLDGSDEVIRGETPVVEDDRDPATFRAVDAGDSQGELAA